MITLNDSMRARFGCKVYKLALDGGFTCPVRDGTLDTRGCIFCSAGGSGEFAESRDLSITEQIEHKLITKDEFRKMVGSEEFCHAAGIAAWLRYCAKHGEKAL